MDQKSQHLEHERGSWGTNFGFLMAAVGSAVGLGNIWGFPYKMGRYGGFAFLIVYLLLVIFVGAVVMLGELTMGRKTGLGAVGAYGAFSKKHRWVGYIGVASAFFLLTFYNVLGGLVMRNMMGFLLELLGVDGFSGQEMSFWNYILHDYGSIVFFNILFVVCNIVIVMGGIQSGIEKFTTVAMPALFFMLLFVIIYIATLPGAGEGFIYMFKPNWEPLSTASGFFEVVRVAAGQMFFSLSLGMGAMITYGSYLDKKEDIQKNSWIIPACDTTVAVMAALAVLPGCAAFGLDYGSGPGLLFNTMQNVFVSMGTFGNLIGFLFYFLVFIAAITSSISLYEVIVTNRLDNAREKGKKANRAKIICVAAVVTTIIGLPVALDAIGGWFSGEPGLIPAPYQLLGYEFGAEGVPMFIDAWLDFFDVLSEGILMPLGALIMTVLIGWVYKTDFVRAECEASGHKYRLAKVYEICFKFITPIGVAIVLIGQIMDFFL